MIYGTKPSESCARCYAPLTLPITYRDNLWFHEKCYNEGARLLANATRISNALSTIFLRIPETEDLH